MVAFNFSPSSESVKFFTVVHYDTPSVSSFSEYLELFSDFDHISVGFSDVIPLVVSVILGNPYISLSYLYELHLVSLMHCICLLHMMRPVDR